MAILHSRRRLAAVSILLACALAVSCCPARAAACRASATVELLFTGDLMFHPALMRTAWNGKRYDFSGVFEKVSGHIRAADFTVGNLEAPVADPKKCKTGAYRFAAPADAIRDFSAAGFDVLTTANNHAADQGSAGLTGTIDTIRSLGLKTTGTWRNDRERQQILMLTHDGVRLAILAYGFNGRNGKLPRGMGLNVWSAARMRQDVKRAKAAGADAVIVCLHSGVEYTFKPAGAQKRAMYAMRAAGVLAVIGHHPHVLQPLVADKGGKFAAAYSLGNVITTTSTKQRQFAALLKLTVRKDAVTGAVTVASLRYVPTWTRMLKGADGKSRLRVYDIRQALGDCRAGTNQEIPKKYLKELTNGYDWIKKTLGATYLEAQNIK